MVCTYCRSETQVVNSRLQKRTNNVWRRRACQNCHAVFSTSEQVDYEKSWAVHYSAGTSAAFLRDKLFVSLYQSCQHRPTALTDAIGLTNTVIAQAAKHIEDGALSSTSIAEAAYHVLKRFDKAAATYYQAYHTDIL